MSDPYPPFWQQSFWPGVLSIAVGVVAARTTEEILNNWSSSGFVGDILGGIVGGLAFSVFAMKRPIE